MLSFNKIAFEIFQYFNFATLFSFFSNILIVINIKVRYISRYIFSLDINECNGNACGSNAVCINTIGSYDCRCKNGFFGNPFVGCRQVQVGPCADPSTCVCSDTAPCPFDYTCVDHKCINQCSDIKCGPRSVCQNGACVCPPGYSGNPNDLHRGCHLHGHCSNDLECELQEICFQIGKGVRKCVDACSKLQCGPNALCITQNHVSACLCIDGYQGNPSNLVEGCQPAKSVIPGCTHDSDCQPDSFCIILDGGVRDCVNPCSKVVCGAYQKCEPDIVPGHATCKCQDGYEWNPVLSSCEKPSVPDCISDNDCHSSEACRPDALGVLKCMSLCDGFTCAANSRCVAENHHGRCDCLPGYTGNPNDRRGCQSPRENRCTTDSECSEDQTCRGTSDGPLACQLVCDFISCGPNALCVVNNHVANCECPPGSYAGDPNDPTSGCRAVPCVYNIDCPPSQLCNRLTHTCYDACDENACGVNAVCIADDHKAICQCPPGLRPNPVPDVECVAVETCRPDSCHPTALCVAGPTTNEPVCRCPPNHVGDPYTTGCQPEGYCSGPKDCPVHSICHEHRCVNPCENACGPNAFCEIVDSRPNCKCIHRFVPSSKGPEHGCVRGTNYCTADSECEDSVCLDGQCRGNV